MASGDQLSPRVRPVQRRAIATFEHILDTAAALLDEQGLDDFNTNLLAERAGVAVRSVYRYFPNKFAVFVALAERDWQPWSPLYEHFLEQLAEPHTSALAAWDEFFDGWAGIVASSKSVAALRRAFLAEPELRGLDQAYVEEMAQQFAAAMKQRGLDLPEDQLQTVGRLLMETADAALDHAVRAHDCVPDRVREEIKLLHRSYLAHYTR